MLQPGQSVKIRHLFTLLLSVAVSNASAGGGWALQQRAEVPLVRVPQLIGQNLGRVQVLLNGSRLRLGRVIRVESGQAPDTVLQQKPEAGTAVPAGSLIDVAVAAPVLMPNLVGLNIQEARAVVSRLKLELVQVVQRVSQQRPGTVVEQLPRTGTPVRPGMQVRVAVAISSLPPLRMPNVVGLDLAEARAVVSRLKLELVQVAQQVSQLHPGTVVQQTPQAGTVIEPGMQVKIAVAIATSPMLRMPNLIGMDVPRVRIVLGELNLALVRVTRVTSDRPPGTVVEQEPPPGAIVKPGTEAVVTIAVQRPSVSPPVAPPSTVPPPNVPPPAPPPLRMPNLIGMDVPRVRIVLGELNLTLVRVTRVTSDRPPGTVVQQEPPPGAIVKPGTETVVTIAVQVPPVSPPVVPPSTVPPPNVPPPAPPPLRMPNLIGMDVSRARIILGELNLALVQVTRVTSDRPPGTVMQQQPPAGTLVEKGATVVVTIAARLVRVPDLIGRTMDEANATLSNVDLRLGRVEERHFGWKSGVVQQQPVPGTGVTAGTPVSIMIVNPLGAYAIWFGGGFAALGAGSLTMRRYLKVRMPHLRVRPDPAGFAEAHPSPAVLWPAEVRVRLVIDPGEQSTSLEGL